MPHQWMFVWSSTLVWLTRQGEEGYERRWEDEREEDGQLGVSLAFLPGPSRVTSREPREVKIGPLFCPAGIMTS